MVKVKGEEKVSNEPRNGRPKRKKRKKELEELRRNVLEAKRDLRQKTAPPKTRRTNLTKALGLFAEQRQVNDDKTQGIDSKGKKTGVKKICSKLLPVSRKQAGFFANGSIGDEIKRVQLPLDKTNRARLQGDFHKFLDVGKSKKMVPSGFEHYLRSSDIVVDTPELLHNLDAKVSNTLQGSPIIQGRLKRSKRKLPVVMQPERANKKPSLQTDVAGNSEEIQWVQKEDKCKRRLFEDDGQDFEPIDLNLIEEIRFSPKVSPIEQKTEKIPIDEKEIVKNNNTKQTSSLNFANIGWLAANRYEELCALVCSENFENCLQEIPYADPLKKAKKALINIYNNSCREEILRQQVTAGEPDASTSSGSCVVLSDEKTDQTFATQTQNKKSSSQKNHPKFVLKKIPPSETSRCCFEEEACENLKKFVSQKTLPEPTKDDFFLTNDKSKTLNLEDATESIVDWLPNGREKSTTGFSENMTKNPSKPAFPEEVFLVPEETGTARYIGDPLRRHELMNRAPNILERNGRHVPAILRRTISSGKRRDHSGGTSSIDQGIFSEVSQRKIPFFDSLFTPVSSDSKDQLMTPSTFNQIHEQNRQLLKAKLHLINAKYRRSAAPCEKQRKNLFPGSKDPPDFWEQRKQEVGRGPNVPKVLTFDEPNPRGYPIFLQQGNDAVDERMLPMKDEPKVIIIPNPGLSSDEQILSAAFVSCPRNVGKLPDFFYAKNDGKQAPFQNARQQTPFQGVERQAPFQDGRNQAPFQNVRQLASFQNGGKQTPFQGAGKQAPLQDGGNQAPFPNNCKQALFQNVGNQVLFQDAGKQTPFQTGGNQAPFPNDCKQVPFQNGGNPALFQNDGMQLLFQDGAKQAPFQNATIQIQGLQYPALIYQNDGQLSGRIFPNGVQNVESMRYPTILYQNGMQNLERNETSSNVETNKRGGFLNNGVQYHPIQNANLEMQNFPRHIKLPDGRIRILVADKNVEHSSNQPGGDKQIPVPKYSAAAIFVGDKNDFNLIYDPQYPQAGYKRTQVQENSQVYQRDVQPAYNLSDVYRPQVPPNYFPKFF